MENASKATETGGAFIPIGSYGRPRFNEYTSLSSSTRRSLRPSAGGGVGEAAAVARWRVRECARGRVLLCGPLA